MPKFSFVLVLWSNFPSDSPMSTHRPPPHFRSCTNCIILHLSSQILCETISCLDSSHFGLINYICSSYACFLCPCAMPSNPLPSWSLLWPAIWITTRLPVNSDSSWIFSMHFNPWSTYTFLIPYYKLLHNKIVIITALQFPQKLAWCLVYSMCSQNDSLKCIYLPSASSSYLSYKNHITTYMNTLPRKTFIHNCLF